MRTTAYNMSLHVTILSVDSEVHSSLGEELQNTNSELEAKCKKFTQQLSVLSDDLQSAEDVNMNLLEQIAHLKEEVAKKGLHFWTFCVHVWLIL